MEQDRIRRLRQTLPTLSLPSPKDFQGGLSSVLIVLGPNRETQREEILLTKRTMHLENYKGQVSFPGGFWEASDATLMDTALREATEEIGAVAGDMEVLGVIESVQTHQGVSIFPWVARMDFPYPFRINPAEVEKVLFLPVQTLLERGLQPARIEVGDVRVMSPAITVSGEVVWGATARMLENLRRHLINTF